MKRRRTLRDLADADDTMPCPEGVTAYLMIEGAVREQSGLCHGALEDDTCTYCAIGSFFAIHPELALATDVIDEVAMVNDAQPSATPKQRRQLVLRWLRWRLKALGWTPGPGRPPAEPR